MVLTCESITVLHIKFTNFQKAENIHSGKNYVNANCGTGSNECRFSMNRAVKFTMIALMMLGILTGTDASPTNPSLRAKSSELSFESSTSSDESVHNQGGHN